MKLNIGDKIGIIALSGDCDNKKTEIAKKNFEQLGYSVELSKNIFDKNRYLAGSDDLKIEELHRFFKNPDIKLILAARGGYGAIRLINRIDYDLIKKNPKPFCGFSDVTALLLMIYKKTGLKPYHSPMAISDWGAKEYSSFTTENFFQSINGKYFVYDGKQSYKSGKASGILWGGNLSTIVSLCGQDFLPSEDFIFFTEDTNEPVYKIDKMFQQLINIKEFTKYCKGIVLGDFLFVDNEDWLNEYFTELACNIDIPIISGFNITHSQNKITLQIGARAEINEKKLILR